MKNGLIYIFIVLFICSCSKDEQTNFNPNSEIENYISAVDLSRLPEIESTNPIFYDQQNSPKDILDVLKENGVNTVRLRLWVNPANQHSGFDEVKQFSETLKTNGFKTWLTLHYSDTWADPGQQETPAVWQGLNFETLKDSVYNYTKKVVTQIQPDYIQIGNEINSGFLHPQGDISLNNSNFKALLSSGSLAVREHSNNCKIILHFAGLENSDWFFNQTNTIDYDIIGLSYYPIWHGHSLENLLNTLQSLSSTYNKQIVIAETAYPFTLDWNDQTNNIVGTTDQLILPEFPASPQGQKEFISEIKTIIKSTDKGLGFCYWGAELVAWKGNQSTTASPWENQALFDFNNKGLPVLSEFK